MNLAKKLKKLKVGKVVVLVTDLQSLEAFDSVVRQEEVNLVNPCDVHDGGSVG